MLWILMTVWVVVHIGLLWTSKGIIEYFDSFGPKEVIKLYNILNLNDVYNSTQYQDLVGVLRDTNYCLYYMNDHGMEKTY